MSEKRECPACDSCTSSVLSAFAQGQPCPYCGLSAEAADELEAARVRGASEALVASTAQALRRAEVAETEALRLRGLIVQARRALDAAGPVAEHAWQEFNPDGVSCHFPGCGKTEVEH